MSTDSSQKLDDDPLAFTSARPAVEAAIKAQNSPDVVPEKGWTNIGLPAIEEPIGKPDPRDANPISYQVTKKTIEYPRPTQHPKDDTGSGSGQEIPESGWSSIALPSLVDDKNNDDA